MPSRTFDHEKLTVYGVALDFVAQADAIAQQLPPGRGYLCDQLRRAATSIALNIAEGAGEFSPDEKTRFYRMARRSATECAAINDVCKRLELIDEELYATARQTLLETTALLVGLIRRVSGERQGS